MKSDIRVRLFGAGLAGNLAAIALAQNGYPVMIYADANADNLSIPANRPMALSKTSLQIISRLLSLDFDVLLDELQATEIRRIHISEQGHINSVVLNAEDSDNQDFFGAVIHSDKLHDLCTNICTQSARIEFSEGSDIQPNDLASADETLDVIADGIRSQRRENFGFDSVYQPYDEIALTGVLTLNQANNGKAYERFTADGPLALLPFGDEQLAFVLTLNKDFDSTALSDAAVLDVIQARIGYRIGVIKSIEVQGRFPLNLHYSEQLTANHSVLLGNAALNIHPIAGQGFNLVVKDIAWLQELLAEQASIPAALDAYESLRSQDHWQTRQFTQSLVKGFALAGIWPMRGVALGLINTFPSLQNTFIALGGGQMTKQPKISFSDR